MTLSRLTCSETSAHLPLFVGGDLEPPLIESVESHLRGCAPCQGELERTRRAREVYVREGLRSDVPDTDVWPAIAQRLEADPEITVLSGPRRSGVPWRHVAGLAAAAGLLVAAGVWMGGTRDTVPAVPAPLGDPGGAGAELADSGTPAVRRGGELVEQDVRPVATGLQRVTSPDERLFDRARPFGEFPQPNPILVPPQRGKNALAGQLR